MLNLHVCGVGAAQRHTSRKQKRNRDLHVALAVFVQVAQGEEKQTVPSHVFQRMKALEMQVQQAYEV